MWPKKIKACIFDLDGTLVETEKSNWNAYNYALEQFGLRIEFSTFIKTSGKDSKVFLNEIFPKLTESQIQTIRMEKTKIYDQFFFQSKIKLKNLTILKIAHKFLPLALVTNSSSSSAHKLLEFHGLSKYFEAIVTGSDISCPKPDPESYFLAANQLNISPKNCLVFEDSITGITAARQAGMTVLKV